MIKICMLFTCMFLAFHGMTENGYELWLRYRPLNNPQLHQAYQSMFQNIVMPVQSPTLVAIQQELNLASAQSNLKSPTYLKKISHSNYTIIATFENLPKSIQQAISTSTIDSLGEEGYLIWSTSRQSLVITAKKEIGLLYGTFQWLKRMQTGESPFPVRISAAPKLHWRMLNHWDNLNRTVERGYAGFSIWNWHTLPDLIDQRYIDYARANASIGINAVVLNNVNANATQLTLPYLIKVKALADLFRPYGIKVFLTARFSAPIEIGGLKTADPLEKEVAKFWQLKATEIYQLIPDFGGFLVKANSEGQPGPQDYRRTHADGANMLAKALAPYKGIVIWRAFVYASENRADRHLQAYQEFQKLDGQFHPNVLVQVKNGAIDFMPREPFHPLFGAMPKTPLMMEFQITQEYLGQATNWVYLAPLYKEVLDSDTYVNGKGSTVAKIIEGNPNHISNGMAGVSNIGNDINWCGHPMAQANWYAFGRLCWDHTQSSEEIAKDWLKMTFTQDVQFVQEIAEVMLRSREIYVNYTNPFGLHHIMGTGHHYGPAPWVSHLSRPEWNPTYYHRADSLGIGFDRTETGSNALSQYHSAVRAQWSNPQKMDERFLLWFHHVAWNERLQNGKTLWENLCIRYQQGVEEVSWMQQKWLKQKDKVDATRFNQVQQLLSIQHNEAIWWKEACVQYFQTFSKQPLPNGYPPFSQTLSYYQALQFPYAPGN